MYALRQLSASLTLVLLSALPSQAQTQSPAVGQALSQRDTVQYNRGGKQPWSALAAGGQDLFVGDSVATRGDGKALVGFTDQSTCTLDKEVILTVRDPLTTHLERDPNAARARLFCKFERQRTLQTFAASVAITGTEVVLEVFADRMVLTVMEGSAVLETDVARLEINAGEEGTARPGEAPTKRTLLSPEDAVQWALYYQTAFPGDDWPSGRVSDQVRGAYQALAAGNVTAALTSFQAAVATPPPTPAERGWVSIGLSSVYQRLNRPADAARAVEGPAPSGVETEWHTQRAAVALDLGEPAAARREITTALAANPRAIRPYVLLATIELTQNRKTEARAAVDRALEVDPNSVAANKVASEVAQAFFELDRALEYIDRALARAPTYVPALINRARLRFGTGNINGARQDAAAAQSLAPDDPLVRSMLGFLELADGDPSAAEQHFRAANQADRRFGEPHLGLGLVRFQQGQVQEGVVHVRNAAATEPRVSLYQSYLGKAYYQIRMFGPGLKALEAAKRLDPQDPTPWLYESFFRRDQNRQVQALRALHEAVARNGNRAVYRGRLLLDRDLATGSVSLAEIYRQLGFEAFGAAEAVDSLGLDVTNASAHLFLSGNFLSQGDRLQAGNSEQLQYFLHAPVNRNLFFTASPTLGFNEYTTLLDSPWRQLSVAALAGDRAGGGVMSRSGNRRFAHLAFFDYDTVNGARPDSRDRLATAFFSGKLAFRSSSDLFFRFSAANIDRGDPEEQSMTVNAGRLDPFHLFRLVDTRNPLNWITSTDFEGVIGFRHEWRPGSSLTAAFQMRDLAPRSYVPTSMPLNDGEALRFSRVVENPERAYNAQFQQVIRVGRQQFTMGVEDHRADKALITGLDFDDPDYDDATTGTREGTEWETAAWLRADVFPWPGGHITVGSRYSDREHYDPSVHLIFESSRWLPMVGMSTRVGGGMVVRAAAFRQANSNLLGSRISPTTIEGFVLDRNDLPLTTRDEVNVALERRRWNTFHSIHAFHQTVESPLADLLHYSEPTARTGVEYEFNRVLSERWTVFGSDQFSRTDPTRDGLVLLDDPLAMLFRFQFFGLAKDQYRRWDNRLRLGVNFIHERGWLVRARHTNYIQQFTDTQIADLEDDAYNATDVDVAYEFAGKRVTAALQVRNLFDQRFIPFIETFNFGLPSVRRRVFATVRWRL